jgi:DNA (cytosine-5)-methyltransferase 1
MGLTYGSVCSGIEAASVAWKPLGWKAAFVSEIEAFPRAVLAHHYPETPLHGDFTTIQSGDYQPIDLLVGGTPCQSFSIAGLRGGLDDDRGNLALEFLRLADRLRPRWLVWENVPGVLSSNGGRDFGAILGGMVELGYGFAYRVLDAQFFGVAQRRRRVFVVGYLGDWRRAAAVLFERDGLSGNPAPRRQAGQGTAVSPTLRAGGNRTGGDRPPGTDVDTCESLIHAPMISPALKARDAKGPSSDGDGDGAPLIAHTVAFSIMPMNSGKDYKARETDIAQPIMAGGPVGGNQGGGFITQPISFALRGREGGAMPEVGGDQIGALRAASGGSSRDYVAFGGDVARTLSRRHDGSPCDDRGPDIVAAASSVRRLTPRECERLQGFPDDYTAIPYRRGLAADGPRYKSLGNSMAVPVMAWIGQRIAAVETLQAQRAAA